VQSVDADPEEEYGTSPASAPGRGFRASEHG
jgi:hypothetical protein